MRKWPRTTFKQYCDINELVFCRNHSDYRGSVVVRFPTNRIKYRGQKPLGRGTGEGLFHLTLLGHRNPPEKSGESLKEKIWRKTHEGSGFAGSLSGSCSASFLIKNG